MYYSKFWSIQFFSNSKFCEELLIQQSKNMDNSKQNEQEEPFDLSVANVQQCGFFFTNMYNQ